MTSYVDQVWWRLLKNCDLYRVPNKQTDRPTNIPLNEHTCKNFYEILASNNDSNMGRGVAATNNIRHYYVGTGYAEINAKHPNYYTYHILVISCIKWFANKTLCPNNVRNYQCSLNTWNNAISKWGCSLLMQSQSEAQFALLAKESTYFSRNEAPSMLPECALCVAMETYLFSMSVWSIHDEVIDNLQSADWIFVILTYGTWMSCIIYLSLMTFFLICQ